MVELLSGQTLGLAGEVIAMLKERQESVATAESLTGGLCCAALTAVPGASAVVRGGLIVYATDLKRTLAGVPDEVLGGDGAVSEPTARHLALGASRRTDSDWAIALTGVAGPAPQDGNLPGTVWVAIHGRAGEAGTTASSITAAGTRAEIRDQAVGAALRMLLARLCEQPRKADQPRSREQ